MRKKLLLLGTFLSLSGLGIFIANQSDGKDSKNSSRSTFDKACSSLVLRALLVDSGTLLDDAYGHSLLAQTSHQSARTVRRGEKAGPTLTKPYGYIRVADREAEKRLADQFYKAEFYREAYYHYWNLKTHCVDKDDPALAGILKRLDHCRSHLPGRYLKKQLTTTERKAKERIVFFVKLHDGSYAEIDAELYGVPKALAGGF